MIVRIVPNGLVPIVIIISMLYSGSSAQYFQLPQIPCPQVFEYAFDGNGYIGIVTLRDVRDGQTTLQIEMTQSTILNSDYSGKLSLNIDKDRVFDYIRAGRPITYRVDFPLQNVVPRVTNIVVNDQRICSGPKDRPPRSTINLEHTIRTFSTLSAAPQQPQIQQVQRPQIQQVQRRPDPQRNPIQNVDYSPINDIINLSEDPNLNYDLSQFLRPTFIRPTTTTESYPVQQIPINTNPVNVNRNPGRPVRINPPPTIPPTIPPTARPVVATAGGTTNSYINTICGKENIDDVKKLAVNGEVIAKSRFPWIVAIYTRNVSALKFQCGGSLISARTVVSAAHCFQQQLETIREENLLLSMGRHNLNDWENAINIGVQKVIQHPEFKPDFFDADIAIVQLKQSVSFTISIRPVCLWQGPTDISVIEGSMGVIVGWGEDESHTGPTSVPKLVNATIVSELTCIRSNERFYYITSNRTLCAGNRDGSGPCMGDSGSGLMIRNGNKWMLRGTVSASLSSSTQQCNLDEYVVYSDIAKFIGWISSNMLL